MFGRLTLSFTPCQSMGKRGFHINQDVCHPSGNSAYQVSRMWRGEVAPMQLETIEQNQRTLRSGLHGNGAMGTPRSALSPKRHF